MIQINQLITLLTKQQNNLLMGYIKQCISNTFLLIKTIEKPEKAVAFYLTFARKKDKKGRIIDLGITPKAYQVVLWEYLIKYISIQ